MKRKLALLFSILLVLSLIPSIVLAKENDAITVGTLTPMSGAFATDLWGTNSADMDVRMLVHGYELVGWRGELQKYAVNFSAVSQMYVSDNNGNKMYSFTIRKDLKYSDGTPITVKDYAFGLLLEAPFILDLGGNPAGYEQIDGMSAYRQGNADTLTGVHIKDDYTIEFVLDSAYEDSYYELSVFQFYPYPIQVIAPNCEVADDGDGAYVKGSAEGAFTADALKGSLIDKDTGYISHPSVSSGPYVLTAYDADAMQVELEINPYFKGNARGEKPSIKHITFKTVSQQEAVDGMKDGSLDLVNRVTIKSTIDELMENSSIDFASYPRNGLSYISFNCERDSVAETEVRQAIAMCLDKQLVVREMVGKYGSEAKGYYGKGQWMPMLIEGSIIQDVPSDLTLDNLKRYPLNTSAAAKLLEGNGWTLNASNVREKKIGDNVVTLDLVLEYAEGSAIGDVFKTAFADQLKKAGINLTLKAVPATKMIREYYRQDERDCDMFFMAANLEVAYDPAKSFSLEDADQGMNNRTGIKDEQLYEAAIAMREIKPGDKIAYCRKWIKFQERFMEVLPMIPVYTNDYYDFFVPALKGYDPTLYQSWSLAIVGAKLG